MEILQAVVGSISIWVLIGIVALILPGPIGASFLLWMLAGGIICGVMGIRGEVEKGRFDFRGWARHYWVTAWWPLYVWRAIKARLFPGSR